jgi:hypothetical protein
VGDAVAHAASRINGRRNLVIEPRTFYLPAAASCALILRPRLCSSTLVRTTIRRSEDAMPHAFQRRALLVLIPALAAATSPAAHAQTADPFIGTWKLNPEKSRYQVGSPPPDFTRTYEDRGGGTVLMIIDRTTAQGETVRSMLAYKRDGKPYPEAAVGAKTIRMSTVRSPDPYTEEVSFSNSTRTETGTTLTVSKDGRTMTQQLRATAPDGRPATNIVVYDKVMPEPPVTGAASAAQNAARTGAAQPTVSVTAGQSRTRTAGYAVPRTPWGDPDFQGTFTTDDARGVPMQRPTEFGERRYLTDEEFAARKQRDDETRGDTKAGAGTFVGEVGTRTLRQTSLVIDPPDGRTPPLTRQAQRRAAELSKSRNPLLPTTWEDRSLFERCITRGVTGIFPTIYGNGLRITQAPGYIVIAHEMIHESRIIPLDGRPPLGAAIRQWMGDSRGRWEGDTLVIETANFTDKTAVGNARHTDKLTLVERLTRTASDTIDYEITISDPDTWTRPWTVLLPLTTQPGYELYPFECHEGNQALRNMLSAARAEEKVIEEYVKKGLEPPPLARPGDNQILPPDPSFGRRR